jgi:murein DD-endopeptidase MepM/ murein hydrolase activator NlpD
MFPSGSKRRKKSREFEILVVPRGDGGGTRSISAGASKLALWGGAAAFVLFLLFFLAFRFTPLGRLVGAQREVASADVETERRIRALAEEISVLKDYNETLRKALGERVEKKESDGASPKAGAAPQKIDDRRDAVQSNDQANGASSLRDEGNGIPAQQVSRVAAEALSASLPLIVPTNGVVTQGFEPSENHFGVDYATKEGAPVYAAAKGYVLFSGWTYDDGNVIILSHGSGVITVYKHNSSLLKSVGSITKRGDVIALVGNTGRTSKGPHLHFEVLKDGVPHDPKAFLL